MRKPFDIRSITLFLCAFCASLLLNNPFNQRNPRLTHYLRAFGNSTNVECSLQIVLFMQNKPNFLDDQMNVSSFITTNYEQRTMNYEIKTNPIQSQYKPNSKPIRTQNEANSKPNKPNFTLLPPESMRHRPKSSLPKISCFIAQDFLCCGHGLFMLWIKKEFFGENVK
jgi:hypothetical protein